VGYYNRGLTLLEAEEEVIPGVSFRVEASGLEHTLTRDNVRRDGAFEKVVARLETLAKEKLKPLWLEKLEKETDPACRKQLLQGTASPSCGLPDTLPCFIKVDGSKIGLGALRPGWFGKKAVYYGQPGILADAVLALPQHVLIKEDAEVVAGLLELEAEDIESRWWLVEEQPGTVAAPEGYVWGRFYGEKISDKLSWLYSAAGVPEDESPSSWFGGKRAINLDHPLIAALNACTPGIQKSLLLHLLEREQGGIGAVKQVVSAILTAASRQSGPCE
jgi:hypothetical protein